MRQVATTPNASGQGDGDVSQCGEAAGPGVQCSRIDGDACPRPEPPLPTMVSVSLLNDLRVVVIPQDVAEAAGFAPPSLEDHVLRRDAAHVGLPDVATEVLRRFQAAHDYLVERYSAAAWPWLRRREGHR